MKIFLFLTCLTYLSLAAPAQFETPKEKFKVFEFDLHVSQAPLHADDFNLHLESLRGYDEFFHGLYGEYYKQKGTFSSTSYNSVGKFRKINMGIPFGASLRINFAPTFGISLGCDLMPVEKKSDVDSVFTYYLANGTVSQAVSSYHPACISITSLYPHGRLHYRFFTARQFNIEAFAGIGEINLVECNLSFSSQENYSKSTGYKSEATTEYDLDGKGKALASHVGVRVNWKDPDGIKRMFIECSYFIGKIKAISGDGSEDYHFSDSNGVSKHYSSKFSGKWFIKEYQNNEVFGNWKNIYPSNNSSDVNGNTIKNLRDFVLDFSSIRLTLGILL